MRLRTSTAAIAAALCATALAACGSEGISVSEESAEHEGAAIFATHCAGCHTLSPAGTQGSGNRALRVQGPDFDQRPETYDEVLFAIRNGGFSGAIMPQNIVVGDEAEAVAQFVSEYAGGDIEEQARPEPEAGDDIETGGDTVQPGEVEQDTEEETGAGAGGGGSEGGGGSAGGGAGGGGSGGAGGGGGGSGSGGQG